MKGNFINTFTEFEDCKPEAIFEAVRVYCLRIAYDWEMDDCFVEHCAARNQSTKALTQLSLSLLSKLNHHLKAVYRLLEGCVLCSVAIDEIDSLITALAYVEEANFGCALYHPFYHGLSLSTAHVKQAIDDFWLCSEVRQALKGDSK
ncbi:hypothetical protein [Acinetobacter higginsii]|uniref:hypothetical protein n=1 Tax=Acinetobacter higginsii TaxID=70347 RepID=UPI001F4AEFCF|nr:hypothetical protein [Acinetobacter higginsii]MCH7380654.1 hypothetical protein [Acinetobacter higginsii]